MTSTSRKQPTYVYKILPSSAAPASPLPERLPVSDLDRSSGFIHLSTAAQVPGTLNLFFSDEAEVHLLKIAYDKVRAQMKWENSQGDQGEIGANGVFPHLYNGYKLGKDEIENTISCNRLDGASWDDALEALTSDSGPWLQY